MHALGANPDLLRTVRVIVASAIYGAIRAGPPQVALAHVVGRALALAVDARFVTSPRARQLAVAHKALPAVAAERAVRVGADGVVVAVVQAQAALVHVRALRVRPARVWHAKHVRALITRVVEVALYAHSWNRTRKAFAILLTLNVQFLLLSMSQTQTYQFPQAVLPDL